MGFFIEIKMTEKLITIDEPSRLFSEHLNIENNNRIIFSGIYGIGKSTFLDNFFKKEKEKYNAIHLFPVNYSIAANDDIIELLKYDIIYELISKHPISVEEIDFSTSNLLSTFIQDEAVELFSLFFENIPSVGKPVVDFIKKSKEILDKYKSFKENMNDGELQLLQKFRKSEESRKGSVYLRDFYIDFIQKKLDELKASNGAKKNVLVIDDLDRIDPEHIFRLLNVFSAHFSGSDNKFGFDKVIFVCDINNVRKIFSNRYGIDVDFDGYIDKFYSVEIFDFNNKYAVKEWLLKFLRRSTSVFSREDMTFVYEILLYLFGSNQLNLRNLNKLNFEFLYLSIEKKLENYSGNYLDLRFIRIAILLSTISGDLNSLIEKMNKSFEDTRKAEADNNDGVFRSTNLIAYKYLFPIIFVDKHKFVDQNVFKVININCNITFDYPFGWRVISTQDMDTPRIKQANFIQYIIDSLNRLKTF